MMYQAVLSAPAVVLLSTRPHWGSVGFVRNTVTGTMRRKKMSNTDEEPTEFEQWWAENKGNQGDPFGYDRRRCEECWEEAHHLGRMSGIKEAGQIIREASG